MSGTWDTNLSPTTNWTLADVKAPQLFGKGIYGQSYYGQGNVIGSLAPSQNL